MSAQLLETYYLPTQAPSPEALPLGFAPARVDPRRRERVPSRVGPDARVVSAVPARLTVTECPTAAPEEGYRMGRWARLAMTLTSAAAALAIVLLVFGGSSEADLREVAVQPGDSLWTIAVSTAPDRDPRDVVEEIVAVNKLADGVLPVGSTLLVPVG